MGELIENQFVNSNASRWSAPQVRTVLGDLKRDFLAQQKSFGQSLVFVAVLSY